MFAVVQTGGKQYRVATNDVIMVEKLEGEPGQHIQLTDVLLFANDKGQVVTGAPKVAGASVTAEVLEQKRGEKIIIFKKKRRQHYRRKNGHRQFVTVLRVKEIKHA